jgi:hypothetical protein
MRAFNIGLGMRRGLAVVAVAAAAFEVLSACASPIVNDFNEGGSSEPDSGAAPTGSSGGSGGSGSGSVPPSDATGGIALLDATVTSSSSGSSSGSTPPGPQPVDGSVTSGCQGCTFPPPNAPTCAQTAPAIKIVYPNDNVLVPPNMNVISVQWTPFGSAFKTFEVDFSQTIGTATTDWRVVTACAAQTIDAQSGTPSGGCEVTIDPLSWSNLVEANRGASNPISITVRGTTDGTCASTSTNTIHLSIAEQDLRGTYYYWKSTVSANGIGGQIFAKQFGDLNNPEQDVTSAALQNATCNGCHSLSRDGSRMVVYSDDNDSDDEYSDIGGSYLDMTPLPANAATEFAGGITGARVGGQPPGFSAVHPLATEYVTSNGYPCSNGRQGVCGTATPYARAVPTNGFALYNGTNGAFTGGVTIGAAGQRPTMPDWSIDATTVVYVQPGSVAQYDLNGQFGTRNDDDHIFGGSLYTVPYNGGGAFGTPTVFLQSNGENNYYPSYSPDNPMRFIIFNRVALDMSAGSVTGCTTGTAPMCPNDSFSNPAARLMLIGANAPGSTPVDLEKANGSPAAAPLPWSNSYPRWAPFVQTYHGNEILWFTFSSTRDYGVRVLNHKTGMYQCYPADALETPGGAHNGKFVAGCQEPQIWMAPLTFTEAQSGSVDPSGVAFWLPYQDITTHNHTAQWTEQVQQPMPDAGTPACTCGGLFGACGPANGGCPCCSGQSLVCSGNSQCIQVAN